VTRALREKPESELTLLLSSFSVPSMAM